MKPDYVLITAARNEEQYILYPLISVTHQTLLPLKWVIVSDGSTDNTDIIINDYAAKYAFIHFVRRDSSQTSESFASKVHSINRGYEELSNLDFSFIGNLDADVSFATGYYEELMARLERFPTLGITGGFIYEEHHGEFQSRPMNTTRSVAGAIQLFRRRCYEEIGGLLPIALGGEDWIAEVKARMKGWSVEAFADLKVLHHKKGILSRGIVRDSIRAGLMDYCVGSHPLFEIMKCCKRLRMSPFLAGAFFRLCGFVWACSKHEKRPVSDQFIRYLRQEQMARLRLLIAAGKGPSADNNH